MRSWWRIEEWQNVIEGGWGRRFQVEGSENMLVFPENSFQIVEIKIVDGVIKEEKENIELVLKEYRESGIGERGEGTMGRKCRGEVIDKIG